jgi:uncharacterized protein (DUF849 family)
MQTRSIITCAVTGAGDSAGNGAGQSPHVPVTPQQIANECIAAARAGAAIAHIHVRDPQTGKPSMQLEYYRETVERIRAADVDIIINLTTGPGARYTPNTEDTTRVGAGSTMATPEQRVRHVVELKPEICSLDVATLNFGGNAMVNIPAHLVEMARMVQEAGAKPELEVFDLGHIRLARDLIDKQVIRGTPLFQLCLGIPWGAPADAETMLAMRNALPPGALWAAFGISRMEFASVALATAMGGHVRVGLEDNLYMGHKQLARGNAELVERAVRIIESIGGTVATVAQARATLGLAAR